jgi:hypothetical protein
MAEINHLRPAPAVLSPRNRKNEDEDQNRRDASPGQLRLLSAESKNHNATSDDHKAVEGDIVLRIRAK